ncbi:MAG: phosphotransferase, partial [Actinobacteria bacterium]|nr:phosphotransferase [Actinomycetota bacterium]
MAKQFWTGPERCPNRYLVAADHDRPRHEPGAGIEGLVYRAVVNEPTAADHGDEVALKVLLACRPSEVDEVRRRLTPLMKPLDPRLMRVRDVFVGTALSDAPDPTGDEFDVVYVTADWVEGTGLELAAQRHDVAWSLDVIAALAEAVEVLHATVDPTAPTGILHRDIKTSNVRVRPDGTPVLVDYGLLRPDAVDASVVGTPGWLAPEVASGVPGGKAADAFGVGAVAFDLIIGVPPRRDGAPSARERLRDELADVPLGGDIAAHIASMLELSPEERPTDLALWATQLRQLASGKRLRRSRLSRRSAAVVLATLAAIVAVAVGAVLAGGGDEPDAPANTSAQRREGGAGDEAAPTTAAAPSTAPPQPLVCETDPVVPDTEAGAAILALFESLDRYCAGAVEPYGEGVTMSLLGESGTVSA